MLGYIVNDFTCIYVRLLDPLFLSLSLYEYLYMCSAMFPLIVRVCPGILLVNLRVYVRLLIGISLSLFVYACVKQCPTILSLIVGVSQCTSLDSCCSLSFLSECFYPCSAILSLILGV